MKNKVVTFGEVMLRFNPEGFMRISQVQKFEATLAGSESNAAVTLANLGVDVSYVTKVPDHDVGNIVFTEMRRFGVDTSDIIRGGNRLGIFYLEKGASQRPSKVIYDRAGSSFALSHSDEYDWDKILNNATWFHFSAITPALSDELATACLVAAKKAKSLGITVSCDINYRSQLWSKEKAGKVMATIMPYVDICINPDIFGIDFDYSKGMPAEEEYYEIAKKHADLFGFKKVAFSLRESFSADRNIYSSMIYDRIKDKATFSKKYDMHIVDRVGGGDCFAGGLIYSYLNEFSDKDAIEFATAASCLKHSVEHDFAMSSAEEVYALMNGDATGRIKR